MLWHIFNATSFADKVSGWVHSSRKLDTCSEFVMGVYISPAERWKEQMKFFSRCCQVWMFSEVSVVCWYLIFYMIWILQSRQIHVITTCTVMTPTHGQDRDTFDWWGFKKRLNDRNKSGLRGQVGLTDVCNKTAWIGLIKEQPHQLIVCNLLDLKDIYIRNWCQKLYEEGKIPCDALLFKD